MLPSERFRRRKILSKITASHVYKSSSCSLHLFKPGQGKMYSIINLSFINHPLQVKSKEHISDPSNLMKIYIGLLGNIIHEWYYQQIFLPCGSINKEIERHRFQFSMKSFMVRSKITKTYKGESCIHHHYKKSQGMLA